MGAGDVLMSIGEAKRLHKQTGQPVMIIGRDGRPIRSDLFDGVPYLIGRPARGGGSYQRLRNGPGLRPYIKTKTPERWTWNPYTPVPADIVFTEAEMEFASPYRGWVMLEPHTKPIGHSNKAWLAIYWQQLALSRAAPFIQCGPSGTRFLQGVTPVITSTFRQALAVMSVCRAYVGTEGGLHHGAAAVGTPAVVIFGRFISPAVTGYAQHRNIFRGTDLGTGARVDCDECRRAMVDITPSEVLANLKEIL